MSGNKDSLDDELSIMQMNIMRDLDTYGNLDPSSNATAPIVRSQKYPYLQSSQTEADMEIHINIPPTLSPTIISQSQLLPNDSFNQPFPPLPSAKKAKSINIPSKKPAVNGWCKANHLSENYNHLPYIQPPSVFVDDTSSDNSSNAYDKYPSIPSSVRTTHKKARKKHKQHRSGRSSPKSAIVIPPSISIDIMAKTVVSINYKSNGRPSTYSAYSDVSSNMTPRTPNKQRHRSEIPDFSVTSPSRKSRSRNRNNSKNSTNSTKSSSKKKKRRNKRKLKTDSSYQVRRVKSPINLYFNIDQKPKTKQTKPYNRQRSNTWSLNDEYAIESKNGLLFVNNQNV